MKITAQEVKELGCVDDIIPEPLQGGHEDFESAAAMMDSSILSHLQQLIALPTEERLEQRRKKFRNIAQFYSEV
jgi:acetyl-CoA carboxylase carboxyl transferase subunit alpha